CGLLLFWLILLILETEQPRSRTNRLLALFVATVWLLHPLLSSTVLYVVQRMTQLSALFTLLALISYITARRTLPTQHRKGLLLLFVLTPLLTLAAFLSKENGALAPLLCLCIEFFL